MGSPHQYFIQHGFEPLDETKPKLMLAMEGAILDCALDINQVFNQLGPSLKVWMIVQVHYEPVNPDDEKHKGFDAYLRTKDTKISKLDGTINGWGNHMRGAFGSLLNKSYNTIHLSSKRNLDFN